MTTSLLGEWLAEKLEPGWRLMIKKLSANDTGQTASHQAGPYVPKRIAFEVAPDIKEGRKHGFEFTLDSHGQESSPNLSYYASKDECHLTRFGGKSSSLQDPMSTGTVLALAFDASGQTIRGWLARSVDEEDAIAQAVGESELLPGVIIWKYQDQQGQLRLDAIASTKNPCQVHMSDLPPAWAAKFPKGIEITNEATNRIPAGQYRDPDTRLVKRYECEFELFKVIEANHYLPLVKDGFTDMEAFREVALSFVQRRKSRGGKAVELQLCAIFDEEAVEYSFQGRTERTEPDFLFPSVERYRKAVSGDPGLHMLGVKSTSRERWRQVLDEADNIPDKHLFTLDWGVSKEQFRQMQDHKVQLVVPQENVSRFPTEIRSSLINLRGFIGVVKPGAGGP